MSAAGHKGGLAPSGPCLSKLAGDMCGRVGVWSVRVCVRDWRNMRGKWRCGESVCVCRRS